MKRYINLIVFLIPCFIYSGVNINEVFYSIPEYSGWNSQDQWIEIFNFSSSGASLNSWKLKTSAGEVFTFSVTIEPGQRILFVADSSRFVAHWDSVLSSTTVIIQYGGAINVCRNVGSLTLINSTGAEVSSVAWGGTGTSQGVSPGYSLGLYPESNPEPAPDNYTVCYPTPGNPNRELPHSVINPSTWGRIKAMFSTERR
ncbi:lamin tail domain-containing protein [candidate division WOR-3 bacterium]|nr:lamin tail domain-containing protein [candidate division WOR-3 bacterium]